MTSSASTRPGSGPDPLAGRYDAGRRGRRAVAIAAGVTVSAAFLGWLAWATVFHADPEVSSEEIGYTIVDDYNATTRVRIDADPDLENLTCSLRAISSDKAVVGETAFTPEAGQRKEYTIGIRTERRATTVEWIGCKADGQPRFR